MSVSKKLRSASEYLFQGRFLELFNALTRFLGLSSILFLGDKRFFSIDSAEVCRRRGQPLTEPLARYVIKRESDPQTAIPDLLKCMEGSSQFPWIPAEKRQEHFENLFQKGSRPWIARNADNGEAVAFIWETGNYYFVRHGKTRIQINLNPGSVFIEIAFVKKEYRRCGLFTMLLAEAHQKLKTARLWAITDSDNAKSFNALMRYGFRPDGRATHLNIFYLVFASIRIGNLRKRFFRLRKDKPYILRGVLS